MGVLELDDESHVALSPLNDLITQNMLTNVSYLILLVYSTVKYAKVLNSTGLDNNTGYFSCTRVYPFFTPENGKKYLPWKHLVYRQCSREVR